MIDNEYDKKAFSEIIEILNHTDKQIVEKIPNSFIKFLFENMDSEYKVKIDFFNEKWDETILEDTKAILALIYRDYIVSKAEREELIKQQQEEAEKEEEKLREKYNPDNVFKKKEKTEIQEENNNMQLVEIKEETWYKKIWKKIISFFGVK